MVGELRPSFRFRLAERELTPGLVIASRRVAPRRRQCSPMRWRRRATSGRRLSSCCRRRSSAQVRRRLPHRTRSLVSQCHSRTETSFDSHTCSPSQPRKSPTRSSTASRRRATRRPSFGSSRPARRMDALLSQGRSRTKRATLPSPSWRRSSPYAALSPCPASAETVADFLSPIADLVPTSQRARLPGASNQVRTEWQEGQPAHGAAHRLGRRLARRRILSAGSALPRTSLPPSPTLALDR